VHRSGIKLWSEDRNPGLPSRAASTYHTALNYPDESNFGRRPANMG